MSWKFLPLITLLLCLTIFAGLKMFAYDPIRSEIMNMRLETQRVEKLMQEVQSLKARHGSLSELAADKESELDEARKFLPPELLQDRFTAELYSIAARNKVQLTSVQAGEISGEEFQRQVISVQLEADYISLVNFLREVMDDERLTKLTRLSVESLEGGRILSCELSFEIFATKSD